MTSNSVTHFCKACFKPIPSSSFVYLFGEEPQICEKCLSELGPRMIEFKVEKTKGLSVFLYNEEVRNKLYTLKGCFDIEMAGVFLSHFGSYFRLIYHGYFLIGAPSNLEKDEVRGFNHVEQIFACLRLPFIKAIRKTSAVKQSDLHYAERQRIGEKLEWISGVNIQGKKILLVDDVMTTGATIKACLKLIKSHHPKRVKILVMSKTPSLSLRP